MYNIEIEYDPQSDQHCVIDPRPEASDRFYSQHDNRTEAEVAATSLAEEIEAKARRENEMPW